MPRWISEADVRQVLDYPDALAALESAFRQSALIPPTTAPRARIQIAGGGLSILAADLPWSGHAGIKAYTYHSGRVVAVILLFDSVTGDLLAAMGADYLGQVRTGASCGVATRWLAREDARHVGLLGVGKQARSMLKSVCLARQIKRVAVFSPNVERRQSFCLAAEREFGVPVEAAPTAEAAVSGADIICTATSSTEPVFRAEWISRGALVNAIGSGAEIDAALLERAEIIGVDSRAQAMASPIEMAEVIAHNPERLREIGEIIASGMRRPEWAVTIFRCYGWAVEDVALAEMVYQKAVERQLGFEISL